MFTCTSVPKAGTSLPPMRVCWSLTVTPQPPRSGCAVHDEQEPCFLYGSACWGRVHSQGEQSREQGSAVTNGPEGHTRRTCAITAARHGGRPRWSDSVLGLSPRSVVRLCPWAVMGGSAPAMLTRPPWAPCGLERLGQGETPRSKLGEPVGSSQCTGEDAGGRIPGFAGEDSGEDEAELRAAPSGGAPALPTVPRTREPGLSAVTRGGAASQGDTERALCHPEVFNLGSAATGGGSWEEPNVKQGPGSSPACRARSPELGPRPE